MFWIDSLFLFIGYAMNSEAISLSHFKYGWIMVVEMVMVYMVFFLYTYKNPEFKEDLVLYQKDEYITENKFYGISIVAVLAMASMYISLNRSILIKYFTLNTGLAN